MYGGRKMYGYYPIRRDQEVIKMVETSNKTIGKVGFCIGLLSVGGYYLYKKVNELSRELKKLKEEMRK